MKVRLVMLEQSPTHLPSSASIGIVRVKERGRGWSSNRETKHQQQIPVILPWNTDHARPRRLNSVSGGSLDASASWQARFSRCCNTWRLALCSPPPNPPIISICMSELPHPLLLCKRSTPASEQGRYENIGRGKCQARHFFFSLYQFDTLDRDT